MPEVSIILKTNRTNEDTGFKEWKDAINRKDEKIYDNPIVDADFIALLEETFNDADSFIEPTLNSLANSSFKDFEVVIVHRKPDAIIDSVKKYNGFLSIKLIKEKHSIWHDLDEKYCTISNAINTGIIWSDGDLLISIDDCSLLPRQLIKELYRMYKSGMYGMPKAIKYSFAEGPQFSDSWTLREYNKRVLKETLPWRMKPGEVFGTGWGYCLSFSLQHALEVNGFDESLDGALLDEDGDFCDRVAMISSMKRIITIYPIYFFGHKYSNVKVGKLVRYNKHFRVILGQKPFPPKRVIANVWRPSKEECERYKKWHIQMYGEIDENFDACMRVPTFNLSELREKRQVKKSGSKDIGKLILSI